MSGKQHFLLHLAHFDIAMVFFLSLLNPFAENALHYSPLKLFWCVTRLSAAHEPPR